MFKNLRINILNWLAAGRLVIEKDRPMANTYTLGNLGGGIQYNYNPPQQAQQMQLGNSTINFNVAKANGGWIVQVNPQQTYNTMTLGGDVKTAELYLIHDDEDFDAALGRIVTTSCLKA
jgi:hypothetical protein